jgi:archaellum component FlaC
MEKQVEKVYETFNSMRKSFDAQKTDESELEELKRLEKEIKRSK